MDHHFTVEDITIRFTAVSMILFIQVVFIIAVDSMTHSTEVVITVIDIPGIHLITVALLTAITVAVLM